MLPDVVSLAAFEASPCGTDVKDVLRPHYCVRGGNFTAHGLAPPVALFENSSIYIYIL